MKFLELGHPATQHDVENGHAIFTFEGLGNRRVWKMPKCPMFSDWPAFGDRLSASGAKNVSSADTSGCVCQAEELKVNGQWKRYFGWIGKHGATVVPADEIYLSFGYSAPSGLGFEWEQLPGGTDWGMLAPDVQSANGKYSRKQLNPGDPLRVNIQVRNRCGVAKNVVGEIYRGRGSGGPALRQGIKLHVAWAPFDPRTPDQYYPRLEDFRELQPTGQSNFNSTAEGPVLEPGGTAEGATFDLRDWFSCDRPGYYHFAFGFNPAELGLGKETEFGPGVYIQFEIGKSPRKLSARELNKEIPAFGAVEAEAKLNALIPFTVLASLNLNAAGKPAVSEIDFGWCDFDFGKLREHFQKDARLKGRKLEPQFYQGPLDHTPVLHTEPYTFAAWNRTTLIPLGSLFLERAPAYETCMTFAGTNSEGNYVFKLARLHQGHAYYHGSSGAPIAAPDGMIISMVLGGCEKSNEIYGLPLANYARLLHLS